MSFKHDEMGRIPGVNSPLRVAVDNTNNVEDLPVRNLMDIAAMARGFAEDLEKAEYGEVNRTVVIVETEEGLHLLCWGESLSRYEAIGLFETAKLTSYASNFEEE